MMLGVKPGISQAPYKFANTITTTATANRTVCSIITYGAVSSMLRMEKNIKQSFCFEDLLVQPGV